MASNQRSTNSNKNSNSNRGDSRRPRDAEGRFTESGWTSTARDRPYATAAVAAGVAAAGAFLWSRRSQISDMAETGMDKLSEMKSDRMSKGRSQDEIAEEALTLKETGASRSTPSMDSTSRSRTKAGAISY